VASRGCRDECRATAGQEMRWGCVCACLDGGRSVNYVSPQTNNEWRVVINESRHASSCARMNMQPTTRPTNSSEIFGSGHSHSHWPGVACVCFPRFPCVSESATPVSSFFRLARVTSPHRHAGSQSRPRGTRAHERSCECQHYIRIICLHRHDPRLSTTFTHAKCFASSYAKDIHLRTPVYHL
jgi:hypothetical protein